MLGLSKTKNSVIDLSIAQSALIDATRYSEEKINLIACKTLAGLSGPDAQRAIAEMALTGKNALDVRVSAFHCLAASAKQNANLLDSKQIDAIYSLINSTEVDSKLRSAAATAFGALNLPSEKVKNLILDQARS